VPSKRQARFGGRRTHAPQRCDGVYPTLVTVIRNRKDARSNPDRYLPWNYRWEEAESLAA
jgi:hypothetical protein